MTSSARLLAAVSDLVLQLPGPVVRRLIELLTASPSAEALAGAFPQPGVFERIQTLLSFGRPASDVALALNAALEVTGVLQARHHTELVWSGPPGGGLALRRTEQVLAELINGAIESIWLVTFAAYRVPGVVRALENAVARGVRVAFVVDDQIADVRQAMGGRLLAGMSIYSWPVESRPRNASGDPAHMHVKCAIIDERTLLVSSANLTAQAMDLNMELGVLVGDPRQARAAAEHFGRMIANGVLVAVSGW